MHTETRNTSHKRPNAKHLARLYEELAQLRTELASPSPRPGALGYYRRLLKRVRWYQGQGLIPRTDEPGTDLRTLGVAGAHTRRLIPVEVSPDLILDPQSLID